MHNAMHNEDRQLLHRFATQRDEAAFETLVRRHLGLVLGAARRQLGGDHHAAEDVAQQVFTLLAQKAGRLRHHTRLEAWLHTTTRFACQTHIRTQIRRDRREQEAAVNLSPSEGVSLWEKLAPVLDEALCDLSEKDRGLILQRHINRESGETMAARLGVSESALRKRLERALNRLREGLAKRGIAIAAVALASALELKAQAQVSAGLASQVARRATAQAGAAAGTTAWLAGLRPAVLIGTAALVCSLAILLPRVSQQANTPLPAAEPVLPVAAAIEAPPPEPVLLSQSPTADVRQFTLHIQDAETRQPLPGASVLFWVGYDERSQQRIAERAWASNSPVQVAWTNDCLRFIAQVECEGYADTWLEWTREQGVLPVPDEWTFLMEQAPTIGGEVVDEKGHPVPGANVAVWLHGDLFLPVPGTQQPALSHPARWLTGQLNATTDPSGRWAVRSIGRAVQNSGMTIVVTHPDYRKDRSDLKPGNALPDLQAETYRSVLVPTSRLTISGVVQDSEGNPLPGAHVSDGTLYSNPGTITRGDQHLFADSNGAFSFTVASATRVRVTAKADGFAARTVLWSGEPLCIRLKPGRNLRLRVVNPDGEPLSGVRVDSTAFQTTGGRETNQSTLYQLQARTDMSGRVEWSDVPDEPLLMMFWSDSPHYLSRGGEEMYPGDQEQIVVLTPSLKISGTVTDAESGERLPLFRVASVDARGTDGIPPAPPFLLPGIVSGKPFQQGQFELELSPSSGPIAPSLRGPADRQQSGVYLKITAPGYAAYTSRFLGVQGAERSLRVALKRASHLRVQILNPNGYAVADADLVAVAGEGGLKLDGGRWMMSGDYVLTTDAAGYCELPPDESVRVVIAMDHARTLLGWATMDALRREGRLRLSQLHRLELFPQAAGAPPAGECDVKLTSAVLEQLTGDRSPLWAGCDVEGKCVFVGLPSGSYQATLLPRKGATGHGPGRSFSVELPTDAPAQVRYALPADDL